jgi:U4/U6.U5 tri-snRNP-associated protein 1
VKREKDLAARRARDMEEADREAYGEGDLTGLKVAHDMEDLEAGEDIILTLKDSKVLEGEEDELQNVNIADLERDKAAKDRKRKANATYQGYDDDEFTEGRIGKKAAVLDKYDDGFDSGTVDNEGFRLGAPVKAKKETKVFEDDITMLGKEPDSKVKLDLDFVKNFEVSDYMKEGDKGFKVKKRRVKKSSSRRKDGDGDDDDGQNNNMDVDPAPTFTRRVVGDDPDNLVDDDDLQAALARSRRESAKKKPKAKPEDFAARLARQREEDAAAAAAVKAEPGGDEDEADGDDGRITFDDTSEFVRNVTAESRAAVKKERSRTRSASPVRAAKPVIVKIERAEKGSGSGDEKGDRDAAMDSDAESEDEDDELAELAAREGLSLAEYRARIDAQMTELAELKTEEDAAAAEVESQKAKGMGMAGMLSMLRNQGSIAKRSEQDEARDRAQKQHDLWLADHRRRAAQREVERIAARGGNKDQAQREYENRLREQTEAREAVDVFKNYKPDVDIVYHDEFGRKMTPKEAWKSLSHKFQYVEAYVWLVGADTLQRQDVGTHEDGKAPAQNRRRAQGARDGRGRYPHWHG